MFSPAAVDEVLSLLSFPDAAVVLDVVVELVEAVVLRVLLLDGVLPPPPPALHGLGSGSVLIVFCWRFAENIHAYDINMRAITKLTKIWIW